MGEREALMVRLSYVPGLGSCVWTGGYTRLLLDWESNPQPFGSRTMLQQTDPRWLEL